MPGFLDAPAKAIDQYWKGALTSTSDLSTLASGAWYVSNTTIASALGLPTARPGAIIVTNVSVSKTLMFQSIEAAGEPSRLFVQQYISSTWSPWKELAQDGEELPGPVRRELLQQGLTARKGGRIGTGGKGVIALRFDDAHVDFRTKVLPLLIARGLPFTRVTTSKSVAGVAVDPTEFGTMQTYCINNGGEVWNHGATHADVTGGDAAIYTEIITALKDLRAAMPRIPIDCFAPPGGATTIWGWTMSSLDSWADSYAGRLLMSNHGLVSGYLANTYYRPLDGALRDGQIHYSVDAYTGLSTATTLIDRARDWKTGVVMMWHANNLDASGKQSLANFTATLDYLVQQRDAGNIVVLTKSGLGVADVNSSYRDDALVTRTGNPFSETVLYSQLRQSLMGSTRELVATVTGTAGATVTSVIGESSKTHTIPAGGTLKLRHVATIPLDVGSSLVVSIDANTTDAHLYAV